MEKPSATLAPTGTPIVEEESKGGFSLPIILGIIAILLGGLLFWWWASQKRDGVENDDVE